MSSKHTDRSISLCRTATLPFSLSPISSQVEYLSENGFDVTLVCSPTNNFQGASHSEKQLFRLSETLKHHPITIPRAISPIEDLKALWRLYRYFRKQDFDIVHSMTPKAGLLTCIAGWLARVPVRLHTYTGQTWVSQTGLVRFLTRNADRLIGFLNTRVYADGKGQARFLVEEGIVRPSKIKVILEGSVAGIDLQRFDPARLAGSRERVREEIGIPQNALCFAFVGRMTRDKGIHELIDAFDHVSHSNPDAHLMLIGPKEKEAGQISAETLSKIESHPRIHDLGFVPVLETHLLACDVLCMPSYREGFNGALMQAAALGIPTLGSDIYGINDNMVNNQTGLLVPPQNAEALAAGMQAFNQDRSLGPRLGQAARQRIIDFFDVEKFNMIIAKEYRQIVSYAECGSGAANVSVLP